MAVLEIIHVRSVSNAIHEAVEQIKESLESPDRGAGSIVFYRMHGVATDVAIHLRRGDGTGAHELSEPGLRIAAALRELGIVEHTLWKEV